MNKQVFKLYACCIPTKGNQRAIICDLQRNSYQFIPLGLYEILTEHKNMSLDLIQNCYENQHDELIAEYFDYLLDKEYGFWCDNPENFPDIDLHFELPQSINNAIIDLNAASEHDFEKITNNLEILGCAHLEVRFFEVLTMERITEYLQFTIGARIRSITLYLMHSSEITDETLQRLLHTVKTVISIIIHNAPSNNVKTIHGKIISHIKQPIQKETCCGIISSKLFVSNIDTFTEAQKHNTCLNKKISIDKEGFIKNCPSMKQHYGNIRDTTLQQALEHPDFKKYWNVHKDQIKICKDCEFRYICTDCRAYVEDPKDMYSKPLKCGYNPYTCEWEEWSTNPLKQKAIDHYNLRPIL
jgi:SPASM domain peptide maturase of grasp-with-spasm system